MQRKMIIMFLVVSLIMAFSSITLAETKHILLIAKPDQTDELAEYLEPHFKVTIATEAELLDFNSELFTEAAFETYDAIFLGELVVSAGTTGSKVMDPSIQENIKKRVADGAGFVHIGGWCSYQGGNADWSGLWHGTPIEEILPVKVSSGWDTNDDGCNLPRLDQAKHPIIAGLDWRALQRVGGYNKVTVAEGGTVIMSDPRTKLPLIVSGTYGKGKTLAYTPGLAGGWDEDFIKWSDFPKLWVQIANFLVD